MERKFLMENANPLSYSTYEELYEGAVFSEPEQIFLQYCYCINYFSYLFHDLVDVNQEQYDQEKLVSVVNQAVSKNLFGNGGIQIPSFLAFLAIIGAFNPSVYVESGVFRGSSLFAFESAPSVEKIWAFDPNMNNLRFDTSHKTTLVSDTDFSAFKFELKPERAEKSFVYFDDHINTANRIISAHDNGFKLLAFDDSNGIVGIKQRLYPAMPTLPLIINIDHFSSGQLVRWNYLDKSVTFEFSPKIIELCREAKSRIKKCCVFPGPGTFCEARSMSDEKYLIALS